MVSKKAREKVGNVIARKERKGKKKRISGARVLGLSSIWQSGYIET